MLETEAGVGVGSGDTEVIEQTPASIWQRLQEQIKLWYFKPDFQAVQLILAFEASYQLSDSDHLWMHLIGPSSGGKTSLGIAIVDSLYPDHFPLGEITPNTFLSGLTRGKQKGKYNSFLHQIGERGLIFAPDFTNFLASDVNTVGKVAGQLREIYDGKASRRAGSMESANNWKGSVAVITAFTPSREHAWHAHNREGERFLTLRWPSAKPVTEREKAEYGKVLRNTGDKSARQEGMRMLVREMLEIGKEDGATHRLVMPGTDEIQEQSHSLAELVGLLRTLPVRPDGKNISHVAAIEGPGRVYKQFIKAASGWASMMGRDQVTAEDWKLAERLAVDTIPEPRRWVLEAFPWDGVGVTNVEMVLEMTPFENKAAVEWHLNDLLALKVVGTNASGEWWLRHSFMDMAQSGCQGWVERMREGFEERVEVAMERASSREFEVVR